MSKKRKLSFSQLSMEFAAGAFFFIALALLLVFTVLLSRESLFGEQHILQARFDQIMGLSKGDNVMVRGLEMGKVKTIGLDNDRVLVTMTLKNEVELHEGYQVQIRFSSVLGGRHVMILTGDASLPTVAAGKILEGSFQPDVTVEAAETLKAVREEITSFKKELDDKKVVENIAGLAGDLREVASRVRSGEGTVAKLINDPAMYREMLSSFQRLGNAAQRVDTSAKELNNLLTSVANGEGTIGKLMNDESLYNNADNLIAGINEGKGTAGKLVTDESLFNHYKNLGQRLELIAARMEEGKSSLGKVLSDDGELYTSVKQTADALRKSADSLAEGEGTLGKLVNDPELYNEAMKLVEDVRTAIDDFREQATVSAFGSLVFGAL